MKQVLAEYRALRAGSVTVNRYDPTIGRITLTIGQKHPLLPNKEEIESAGELDLHVKRDGTIFAVNLATDLDLLPQWTNAWKSDLCYRIMPRVIAEYAKHVAKVSQSLGRHLEYDVTSLLHWLEGAGMRFWQWEQITSPTTEQVTAGRMAGAILAELQDRLTERTERTRV